MKIKKVIAQQGSQVNIADKIGKIQFLPSMKEEIKESDFDSLKNLLLQLEAEDLEELKEEVSLILQDDMDSDSNKLNGLKNKVNGFLVEHSIPISQSLTAATIVEVLKVLFM